MLQDKLPTRRAKEVTVELKEHECAQVGHHKEIGKTIDKWQKKGWRLHTYQAAGYGADVKHYLLFERGE